jgi:hypothetical protein
MPKKASDARIRTAEAIQVKRSSTRLRPVPELGTILVFMGQQILEEWNKLRPG